MVDEIIASFIVLGSLEKTSRESQQKVIIIIMMYAASSFVIITPSSMFHVKQLILNAIFLRVNHCFKTLMGFSCAEHKVIQTVV